MDFLSHPDLITRSISRAEPRQMLAGALPPFLRSKDAASLNKACALFHLEGKVKVVCLCSQSYQRAESLRISSAPSFHSQAGRPCFSPCWVSLSPGDRDPPGSMDQSFSSSHSRYRASPPLDATLSGQHTLSGRRRAGHSDKLGCAQLSEAGPWSVRKAAHRSPPGALDP